MGALPENLAGMALAALVGRQELFAAVTVSGC
jgi:hypothetical protein